LMWCARVHLHRPMDCYDHNRGPNQGFTYSGELWTLLFSYLRSRLAAWRSCRSAW